MKQIAAALGVTPAYFFGSDGKAKIDAEASSETIALMTKPERCRTFIASSLTDEPFDHARRIPEQARRGEGRGRHEGGRPEAFMACLVRSNR
jgi:hypothetical protein